MTIYIYLQLLDLGGTLYVDGKLISTTARIHKIICSHVRSLLLELLFFFSHSSYPSSSQLEFTYHMNVFNT